MLKNMIKYKTQKKCRKLDEWLEDESDKGRQKDSKEMETGKG